jgi:hypothetical protein
MTRYLDALDGGHAANSLPLQTLVALAVERSLDLAAGGNVGIWRICHANKTFISGIVEREG